MSIADELALLANTKESLRVAIGLSTSIPFSQYAANVPWAGDVIPATGTVFDFKKSRYAKDGKAVYLDDVSEFIRLSSATKWHEDQLVEVQNSIPRINNDGLLIEPQRTNSVLETDLSKWWKKSGVTAVNNKGFTTFTADNTVTSGANLIVYGSDAGGSVPISYNGGARAISFLVKDDADIMALSTVVSWGSVTHVCAVIDIVNNTATQNTNIPVLTGAESNGGYKRFMFKINPHASGYDRLKFGNSANLGVYGVVNYIGDGSMYTLGYPQVELTNGNATSFIPTSGVPATRSPDILNIPLLPTQTITGDWDAGVTYSLAGGVATFAGHGYIRNIVVEAL